MKGRAEKQWAKKCCLCRVDTTKAPELAPYLKAKKHVEHAKSPKPNSYCIYTEMRRMTCCATNKKWLALQGGNLWKEGKTFDRRIKLRKLKDPSGMKGSGQAVMPCETSRRPNSEVDDRKLPTLNKFDEKRAGVWQQWPQDTSVIQGHSYMSCKFLPSYMQHRAWQIETAQDETRLQMQMHDEAAKKWGSALLEGPEDDKLASL